MFAAAVSFWRTSHTDRRGTKLNSRRKFWLTGSVLAAAAAIVATLAIPLVASANAKPHTARTVVHCKVKSDVVVDVSQFANDSFAGDAKGNNCSVSLSNGVYKPGAIVAPVTVTTKMKANPAGSTPGYTANIKNKIFTGSLAVALNNPKGTPPPSGKVKVTIGVDFRPLTLVIVIQF